MRVRELLKDLLPATGEFIYHRNNLHRVMTAFVAYSQEYLRVEKCASVKGLSEKAADLIAHAENPEVYVQYTVVGIAAPARIPLINHRHLESGAKAVGSREFVLKKAPPLELLDRIISSVTEENPKLFRRLVRELVSVLYPESSTPTNAQKREAVSFLLRYAYLRTSVLLFNSLDLFEIEFTYQDTVYWNGFEERIVKPVYLLHVKDASYILTAEDLKNLHIEDIPKDFLVDELTSACLWHMASRSDFDLRVSPAFNEILENVGAKLSRNEAPTLADCIPSRETAGELSHPYSYSGRFEKYFLAIAAMHAGFPKDVLQKHLPGISDADYENILRTQGDFFSIARPLRIPADASESAKEQARRYLESVESPLVQVEEAYEKLKTWDAQISPFVRLMLVLYMAEQVPCLFLKGSKDCHVVYRETHGGELKVFSQIGLHALKLTEMERGRIAFTNKELKSALLSMLPGVHGNTKPAAKKKAKQSIAVSLEHCAIIRAVERWMHLGPYAKHEAEVPAAPTSARAAKPGAAEAAPVNPAKPSDKDPKS